jgi:hypothetical protein
VLNLTITSSLDEQIPFEIVHLIVYVLPKIPLKVEVALDAFPNEPPMPLTILQPPVPKEGEIPANVTLVRPQVDAPVWSGPALADVGLRLNVMTTSSMDAKHGLLLTVQRKM